MPKVTINNNNKPKQLENNANLVKNSLNRNRKVVQTNDSNKSDVMTNRIVNKTKTVHKIDLKQDNAIKTIVNNNRKPKSESFQKAAAFWNSPKT